MRRRFGCLVPFVWMLGCANQPAQPSTGATAAAAEQGSEPEARSIEEAFVSQSGGETGGLVVFWPRVIPRSDDPEVQALAQSVQDKMVQLAEETFPDRAIDVRPEPERVCPRGGCDAATFGVLLVHKGPKCAAVALTSAGQTGTNDLTVWAGEVTLKLDRVAFREYPENHVGISLYAACDNLVEAMALEDESIVAALKDKTE